MVASRSAARAMLVKLDLCKAYDMLRWDFLEEVLLKVGFVRILSCFSIKDGGLRKSNCVGEDDGLKQKKQIKMKQFSFRRLRVSFSGGV